MPYCFPVETPWCVTYRSVARVASYSDEHPFWSLFLTEYMQNVMFELMYAARGGRLVRLPTAVYDRVKKLGVRVLLPMESDATWADAEALLRFVDQVRWALVPTVNRSLPGTIGPFLSVYKDSGNWIKLDPIKWEPVEPPRGLLAVGQTRPALGDLEPVGACGHLAEERYPEGREAAQGSAVTSGRVQPVEARWASRRSMKIHDAAVVKMIEALKLRDALRANGVRGYPTLYAVANLLKALLVDGRAPVVVPREEGMDVDRPGGQGGGSGAASGAGSSGGSAGADVASGAGSSGGSAGAGTPSASASGSGASSSGVGGGN